MAISDTTGTKIYIGPATTLTSAAAIAGATITWVEIGEVESITEFGDQASTITFNSLSDGRVRKRKGVRDAGDVTVNVANDPLDLGQIACIEAEKTKFYYPFKVVPADAPTEAGEDSEFYFGALVMSARINPGAANATIMRSIVLAINTDVHEQPATAG